VTAPDPVATFQAAEALLGSRFKLERLVAANRERVLFAAVDQILKRRVSLRLNFYSDEPTRTWFVREAEALGQLDHPAIRHVYDVGITGTLAYRVGNWIEGEGLQEQVQRGPRPIPAVHSLARDLLSAMEHAHARGVILRRVVPTSLIVSPAGRGTITDARFTSWTLPAIPPGTQPTHQAFMAPEVRDGTPGDAISDVYTAGALLYYAICGQEPPLDARQIRPPS
jgi:serine/threonine-protein kinase